jgi:hypothetical protein
VVFGKQNASADAFAVANSESAICSPSVLRYNDYTSTRHFRSRGFHEALLTDRIVDNKPLFISIEAAGTAASIGLSYVFHRTNHHKLERWVSVVHIGVATVGTIRNYRLGP